MKMGESLLTAFIEIKIQGRALIKSVQKTRYISRVDSLR
jgi:hypothetical protein